MTRLGFFTAAVLLLASLQNCQADKYDLKELKKILLEQNSVLDGWVVKLKTLREEIENEGEKAMQELSEVDITVPDAPCDAEDKLDDQKDDIEKLLTDLTEGVAGKLTEIQTVLQAAARGMKTQEQLEKDFEACEKNHKCIKAIYKELNKISDKWEKSYGKVTEGFIKLSEVYRTQLDKLVAEFKKVVQQGKESPEKLCKEETEKIKEDAGDDSETDKNTQDWNNDEL